MYKLLFLSALMLTFSCSEDKPSAIKNRFYYDTIEKEDSGEVKRELVLPEDNTEVIDTGIAN